MKSALVTLALTAIFSWSSNAWAQARDYDNRPSQPPREVCNWETYGGTQSKKVRDCGRKINCVEWENVSVTCYRCRCYEGNSYTRDCGKSYCD